MSAVDQASLAVLALTNRLVDAGVPALKASELWRLLERVEDPASLFGLDEPSVAHATSGAGLEAGRLVRLLGSGVGLALRFDAMHQRGITALTILDEQYPARLRDRLGAAAPPVLYCAGQLSLLTVDGIGVVGSRDVGPAAVEVTRKVAQQVALEGLPLVSGGAKGVDQIAMATAYDGGGPVIGVLADSLERAIGRSDNRRALLEGRACLCTPYHPDARFSAGSAMGRNKIVYGLSRVTLVVASAHEEGGTWSGATEALKKGYGRVAVWTGVGGGPGNEALVKAGGVAVEEPSAVFELSAVEPQDVGAAQMALDFDTRGPQTGPPGLPAGAAAPGEAAPALQAPGDSGADGATAPPPVLPPGAVVPVPSGICWCGCGKPAEEGAFFLPRHAPGAAQRAAVKHFGSVEQFLVMLGEVPPPPP